MTLYDEEDNTGGRGSVREIVREVAGMKNNEGKNVIPFIIEPSARALNQ